MPYKIQYSLTWVFFVGGLVLSALQVQSDALELTRRDMALVAIGQAVCVGVLPLLPKLQKPPDDARVGKD